MEYIVNFDFIVQSLCEQRDEVENLCMGHCYLSKEVARKINEMQNKPEKNEKEFNLLLLAFHFTIDSVEPVNNYTVQKFLYNMQFTYSNRDLQPLSPPPESC